MDGQTPSRGGSSVIDGSFVFRPLFSAFRGSRQGESMQIKVFLDMGDAIVASSDRHGLLPVEVELDRLSLVQRRVLADLVGQPKNPAYVQQNVRLTGGDQEYAPRVRRPGLAGLLEAVDDMVLASQQKAYQEQQRQRKTAAEKAESEAKELAEARRWSRQFWSSHDEDAESRLVHRHPYTIDTQMDCPICGKHFVVEEIYLTNAAHLLCESVQESIKELALDLRWERMVCGFDRHLAGCRAKAIAKARQDAELQTLFIKSANDEEKERALAGFMSPKEMRKIVTDYLFRPVRGLTGVSEDFHQYGSKKDVVVARRIKYSDIDHDEPCEYLDDDPMVYHVAKAQYLTPERFQFFRLVKAAYRGPSDFTASQEARYLCCYCTRCERKMVGFHVLVTLTSPAGQEFSRRFEPAHPRLALFFDDAIFNTHWES